MLFNSIEFLYFLPIVLILYLGVNFNYKLQNILLLLASYFFYGWWNWKLLPLILFTSLCSWACGLVISKYPDKGKIAVVLNSIVNLAILGVFKYYNFFIESFNEAFALFGKEIHISTLNLILPVGISFYTFQALSYTIDIYRKKISATNDMISYLAYVSFFPQLVAGPIERATNLIPQFLRKRNINAIIFFDGLRQILWGFFKKMVIADTVASAVTEVFSNYDIYSASTLLLGAILFSFQLYCDFSGYSDIAIGTSHLFGFDLMKNFNFPFFSRDIAEFWRRWHISLTTWFRDYVYIPLGGSRVSKFKIVRNTFIVYTLSGFWHGANWTYILWGLINAIFFIPLILTGNNRKNMGIVAENKLLPSFMEFLHIVKTFTIVTFGLIFFRAETIHDAVAYCSKIADRSLLSIPYFRGLTNVDAILGIFFIFLLVTIEWINRDKKYGLEFKEQKTINIVICTLIFALLYCFGIDNSSFIYFQF